MQAKDRASKKKSAILTAAICLFLLSGLLLLLITYSSARLKRALSCHIKAISSDQYRFSAADIRLNVLTGQLTLDSVSLAGTNRENGYVNLIAEKITIRGILSDILLPSSTLRIGKIRVIRPQIEIFKPAAALNEATARKKLILQLKGFFGITIKNIQVREIVIEGAVMNHYLDPGNPHPFRYIRSFDLLVKDFSTGEDIFSRNKLYEAAAIDFRVRNFNRILGDRKHEVRIGEFSYSMKEKKIRATDILLFPSDTVPGKGTLYWVTIPSVEIEQAAPESIIGHDTLALRSLSLKQCNIRVRPSEHADNTNLRELRDFDLYKLVRDDFHLLSIDHVSMEGDKMRIDSRSANDSVYQEFKDIRINMEGFRLDSGAWTNPSRVLYADQFTLFVGSYDLRFNDHVHRFSAGPVIASTFDSVIRAQAIRLDSRKGKTRIPAVVDLACDSVRLTTVDFRKLYNYREMPVREIAAYSPRINISRYEKAEAGNRDHQSLLYHFIGNFIKGIYAQNVVVEKGHFAVNDLMNASDKGVIEGNIDFQLIGVEIDSITAAQSEKLFFASDLNLNLSDYTMKLADEIHRLSVKEVSLSSASKQISIQNLRLLPDPGVDLKTAMKRLQKTELYEIKVPELRLRNTDINQAFFNKKLMIGHFSIHQPDIYMELFGAMKRREKEFNLDEFYALLSNYLSHIEINELEAPGGQLRLVNHSRKGKTIDLTNRFNLHLDHFVLNDQELNKDRLLFSDEFDLTLKDHLFRLSDNVHVLNAEEVRLSSREKSVVVSGATLYPLISSPEFSNLPWHLMIKIPQIRLEQTDMDQIYRNRVLQVGRILIESPEIELFRNTEQTKLNFRDPEVPLPGEMRELNVREARLKNGILKIYQNIGPEQKLIARSGIDFRMTDTSLKTAKNRTGARFSSANIETGLTKLRFDPEKIPYTFSVSHISFSSPDKLLQFDSLSIRSKDQVKENGITGISIPFLRLEGLDPVDAFENSRFHATDIRSEYPVFTINTSPGDPKKNPFYMKLPTGIQSLMKELSAEKVVLADASFILKKEKIKKTYQGIDIRLDGFHLDSLRSENPFGAEELTVSKTGIHFRDKHNYYDFSIDSLSFSSNANRLALSGIRILPRYSREAFQQIIPFQTDYYSGLIAGATLTRINTDRWFKNHELAAEFAEINRPQIEIYRDKRKAFNEKQFRPMPQELIRKIDLPFYFDSVRVEGASVQYTEQPEDKPGAGNVSFANLNLTLVPFSNLFTKNERMLQMKADARFMNTSRLDVQMDFDMSAPNNVFLAKGSLSPFELAALNPITEHNAGILIRSGHLNRFDFSFRADSVKAAGKLWFAYDDLKISVLEQRNGDTREARWLSFLANNLMLKSRNPRTKILVPDSISFERDPKRSVINYWWKSVFSGAKNTFGIGENQKEEHP